MNDKIFINDLEIFAKHGVSPKEREFPQRFLVSVNAKFDATHAKTFDEISYTVDYAKLMNVIISTVQKSSYNLIERLANQLAERLFQDFKLIASLDIAIKKFPEDLKNRSFSSIGFFSTFTRND